MKLLPQQTLLLGSFSKIVTPSFRLGWMVAPDWLMPSLVIAKQAADLHTNYFSQRVILQYLQDNDIDEHIAAITRFYGKQKQTMMEALQKHFPDSVTIADSEGGMFLWATLPEGQSSMALFERAINKKVAFVPGKPFYVGDRIKQNTLRLSYVTMDETRIKEGIKKLAECL